jgi:hypothetical protein
VRKVAVLDEGGDHVCVVTEPVSVRHASPFEPLMLSHLQGLRAGHNAEERHGPPTMRTDDIDRATPPTGGSPRR